MNFYTLTRKHDSIRNHRPSTRLTDYCPKRPDELEAECRGEDELIRQEACVGIKRNHKPSRLITGNVPRARVLWLLAKASNTRLATLSVGNSCLTFLLNRLWVK